MSDNYFKTYSRGSRVQTVEETFQLGQVFTRAPLDSGKARLLINYDLLDNGEALALRKGIRTSAYALPFENTLMAPTVSDNLIIGASSDAVEEDNKRYRLLATMAVSDNDEAIPETNLVAAPAELIVIDNNPDTPEYDILTVDDNSIKAKELYALPLSYEFGESSDPLPKSYYTVPSDPTVHGIRIENKRALARPVGTFAWGDDYYAFNTAGDLMRSKYMPADPVEETSATYITEKLAPKEISVAEATTGGFNMLAANPFDFNSRFNEGIFLIEGILLYDSNGKLITEPLLNTKYTIKLFYAVEQGTKYKIVWQYRSKDSDEWIDIETKEADFTSALANISVNNFSSPYDNTVIRAQAFKYTNGAYGTTPEAFLSIGISFVKTASTTRANRELINYDLSKATGMVYWKNYMWLYGLAQDPTVLFCSDINEPTYFPYPNNIDIFDEPIITVTPFNETLLVFTATQLIQLTLSADGGWTKRVLQSNLNLTDFDGRFVQVVKNMVFFKSGDYYYMIVPKTLSLQNELALAPVSKNIEYFLNEFTTNIENLFAALYEYEGTLTLIDHFNYLNYEDIHNVYVYKLDNGLYVNVVLLYNTVSRTWRMYTYESQTVYKPLRQDATKLSTLVTLARATLDRLGTEVPVVGVQFLNFDPLNSSDWYIPLGVTFTKTEEGWQDVSETISEAFDSIHVYKNWQMLDTGYRDNAIDYNKRFRELQLKFNNIGGKQLNFVTEFILDGDTRISMYKYITEHITDPQSPDYGLIYISRIPVENTMVPGTTALAEESTDLNMWTLDNSRFPEIAFWKARLQVSGKGYTPRFRLMSRTEDRYELLGYTWVYRQMYSR